MFPGTEDEESNFKILCGLAEIHLLDNQLTALSKKQIKIRLAESVTLTENENDGIEGDGDDGGTSQYDGELILLLSLFCDFILVVYFVCFLII